MLLKKIFSRADDYLSLVKFAHTIFALPFAVTGFFIAVFYRHYPLDYLVLLLILLCMFFARNAAMSFNRYIDRKYDKINPRTFLREIPSEIIKPKSALIFVILNSILFVLATYFINDLCFFLSPIALLVILGYSLTKRFTYLCHLILGLGLSLSPIGAYIAVTGKFDLFPVIISLIVLFWVSGFDIIYALQDEDFDKSNNLRSIPALLGKKNGLVVSVVLHFISAILVIFTGIYWQLGYLYWTGTVIFISLLVYQHLIIKHNDLSRVNVAFFTTNGIGSIVFAVFMILDMYRC